MFYFYQISFSFGMNVVNSIMTDFAKKATLFYTVAAAKEADRIGAKLTIPMHYKTESLRFPLATVDPFSDHVQTACRVLSVGETILL